MPQTKISLSEWFDSDVKRNEPELRAFLSRKTPAHVEVDDIIQETYARIVAIRKNKTIQSTRGLLFSIAKNVVNDHLRKKYVSKTISLAEMDQVHDVDDVPLPEILAEKSDDYEIVKEAILTLPKRCRTIFVYRHMERMSHKAIAARLGISVHTVEAQLTIGIQKCRKYFKAKGLV